MVGPREGNPPEASLPQAHRQLPLEDDPPDKSRFPRADRRPPGVAFGGCRSGHTGRAEGNGLETMQAREGGRCPTARSGVSWSKSGSVSDVARAVPVLVPHGRDVGKIPGAALLDTESGCGQDDRYFASSQQRVARTLPQWRGPRPAGMVLGRSSRWPAWWRIRVYVLRDHRGALRRRPRGCRSHRLPFRAPRPQGPVPGPP